VDALDMQAREAAHGAPGPRGSSRARIVAALRANVRARSVAAVVALALALAGPGRGLGIAHAATERIPFDAHVELARLRRVLVEHVFRDGADTARAWDDETGCNHLTLSDPEVRVSGETVVVRMRGEGRKSWQVGSWCSFPFDWTGAFALGLEPVAERESGRLGFEVRSATAEDPSGRAQPVEGALREWLRDRVEPRFADLRLSPGDLVPGLDRILPEFAPGPLDDAEVARHMVESIGFDRVAVAADGLDLGIRFDVDAAAPAARFEGMDGAARAAVSVDSLARLDAFTTFVAESTADETSSRTAREALFAVLLEERHAMAAELAAPAPADPTAPARDVFAGTWPALSGAVRRAAADLPPEARGRYDSFLAAGDALRAIAGIGANSPFEATPDGLAALARLLAPDVERDPLAAGTEVDPRLRTLFGFGAPLAPTAVRASDPRPQPTPAEAAPSPAGVGATGDPGVTEPTSEPTAAPTPDPLARLARWVPTAADADAYLATARDGLAVAVTEVAASSPGSPPSLATIVPALAWQRSCWRFWLVRGEQVVSFASPAGGVGWLGVDPRVWRGFFDPSLLRGDPGYNARAGAEIAARLASPGLRSTGEEAAPSPSAEGADGALREAAEIEALYDGGPAELRRLREGRASPAELAGSRAFRDRLVRIRAGQVPTAAECFPAEATPTPVPMPSAAASPEAVVPAADASGDAAPSPTDVGTRDAAVRDSRDEAPPPGDGPAGGVDGP